MEKVTGIGGVFFRAKDASALRNWYATHLGIDIEESFGGSCFSSVGGEQLIWAPFAQDSTHFPGSLMINYRVESLTRMLEQLRSGGASVDDRIEESEFGKFGWATDPEGNRIELWEPPAAP
jgi:predicted enzyme related to lactoylglutathione lyase